MKKIVKARFGKNKLVRMILYTSLFFIVFGLVASALRYYCGTFSYYNNWSYTERVYSYREWYESYLEFMAEFFIFNIRPYFGFSIYFFPICIYAGLAGCLLALFFAWKMNGCVLTVEEDSIRGKTSFRKDFSLPISKIASVEKGKFDQITIMSSSKRYCVYCVENREEIYGVLTELLRSKAVEHNSPPSFNPSVSSAEELRKYKQLLDEGIITQEEFQTMKSKILGI